MRRVIINGIPPQDWVDEAEAVTQLLRDAEDEAARKVIIDANEGLWRDDRVRNWLLDQFGNKCWYSEAYESVSSIHVDHYRPKCRIKDLAGNTCEGYWWLAFKWSNYRISGQLLNVKKGDLFPIVEGARANSNDPVSLELEAPLLIDPLTEQARLISYEKDEDACVAVPASGINGDEAERAENTIAILGLNKRDRLNQKRATYWDKCLMTIEDYKSAAGPQALRLVHQLSALKRLKEMVEYKSEFSSISEACIRKNAPEPLIANVFGG
ncbi:MAG: hypothetical protein KKD63_05810 [Proteobacteria bacterium]|nr:hypothetical protein [Pseudomonadota bacterium]